MPRSILPWRALRRRRADVADSCAAHVLLVALDASASRDQHVISPGPSSTVAHVNLVIGLAAIIISTYLALLNQASALASYERACLLDVTHDAIFVRNLDDSITYWNGVPRSNMVDQRAGARQGYAPALADDFSAPLQQITSECSALDAGRENSSIQGWMGAGHRGEPVVAAAGWSAVAVGILETITTSPGENGGVSDRPRVRKFT